MIEIDIKPWLFIAIYLLMAFFVFVLSKLEGEKIGRRIYRYLTLLYFFALVRITIFPIRIGSMSDSYILDSVQLVPFETIDLYLFSWHYILIQIVGNILLCAPIPLIFRLKKKPIKSFPKLLLIGAIFTCSIEASQLVENLLTNNNLRVVDIDDVILNMIGITIVIIIIKIVDFIRAIRK